MSKLRNLVLPFIKKKLNFLPWYVKTYIYAKITIQKNTSHYDKNKKDKSYSFKTRQFTLCCLAF